MTVPTFQKLLAKRPFQPFRLVMSSGKAIKSIPVGRVPHSVVIDDR